MLHYSCMETDYTTETLKKENGELVFISFVSLMPFNVDYLRLKFIKCEAYIIYDRNKVTAFI